MIAERLIVVHAEQLHVVLGEDLEKVLITHQLYCCGLDFGQGYLCAVGALSPESVIRTVNKKKPERARDIRTVNLDTKPP